jgi:hypothetical protein
MDEKGRMSFVTEVEAGLHFRLEMFNADDGGAEFFIHIPERLKMLQGQGVVTVSCAGHLLDPQ